MVRQLHELATYEPSQNIRGTRHSCSSAAHSDAAVKTTQRKTGSNSSSSLASYIVAQERSRNI